jgi:hypothetical protein
MRRESWHPLIIPGILGGLSSNQKTFWQDNFMAK